MKTASVSELKTRLTAYLADGRRGESIVVYDRAVPIARLVPYAPEPDEGFTIVPPSRPAHQVRRLRGLRPKRAVDVVRLLRGDR